MMSASGKKQIKADEGEVRIGQFQMHIFHCHRREQLLFLLNLLYAKETMK